jgi:hypothetical protein
MVKMIVSQAMVSLEILNISSPFANMSSSFTLLKKDRKFEIRGNLAVYIRKDYVDRAKYGHDV